MALFSRKKKETTAQATVAPAKVAKKEEKVDTKEAKISKALVVRKRGLDSVLLSPRITEKATGGNAIGCYVFDIPRGAGKRDVREAVIARYGVTPRQIRTTKVMAKNVLTRGSRKSGVKAGGKKAYVYLKAGDKIELV